MPFLEPDLDAVDHQFLVLTDVGPGVAITIGFAVTAFRLDPRIVADKTLGLVVTEGGCRLDAGGGQGQSQGQQATGPTFTHLHVT